MIFTLILQKNLLYFIHETLWVKIIKRLLRNLFFYNSLRDMGEERFEWDIKYIE